ncbi:MAG: YidC/Oxa1 family insertase periplasmic-domain containing protein, partial [Phycisphaerae bacterium]|nr:YidC/Oxa1 family insertase periplasmic-domain containing protein [Phycisphaerae bacterium]
MNEKTRRIVITLAVLCLAAGILGIIIFGGGNRKAKSGELPTDPVAAGSGGAGSVPPTAGATPPASGAGAPAPATSPASAPATVPAAPAAASTARAVPAVPPALSARAPGEVFSAPIALGSLDWRTHKFQLHIAPNDVGIQRVVFSEFWRTAEQSRAATSHWDALIAGRDTVPPLPPEEDRYTLRSPGTLAGFDVSLMAARVLVVDGAQVNLYGLVWSQVSPGEFATSIVDESGAEQLRVTRKYLLTDGFDVGLEQRVQNTGAVARNVQWIQNGPPDMGQEPGQLVETRRFQSGYLMSPERDPSQQTVIVHGAMLDHSAVLKQVVAGDQTVWPTQQQTIEKYGLSWFGSTNRYFALAVHAPYAPPTSASKLIAPAVQRVEAQIGVGTSAAGAAEQVVYTFTRSAVQTVEPGKTAAFDVGVFAGPLDRVLLSKTEPYAALSMQGLILYLMSGCCSWCTFSWLADLLIGFLALLHNYVVFDWAVAIIVLVVVVRLLLHPLSRRSQIAMQRVSRQMAALKPELDALKSRYKDDPKKIQEEQMRLYREHQINPLGCAGGMLPTFLQMPIWIALYAMLYFAFELRQQPAFFGIFQKMGGWGFLGDLSAPDNFIPLGVN